MREDLQRLPAGLDTPVQPGGMPLTDTQARCVVLARALLSQPRLLLIDDLLDGLSDDALPVVMEALTRRTDVATIVIATGRNDVAQYCQRSIPLSPTASAQHGEARLTANPQHH